MWFKWKLVSLEWVVMMMKSVESVRLLVILGDVLGTLTATVLVSYMPHHNKNVIIFSFLHDDDAIDPLSQHKMKTRHHNIQ